MELNKEIIEFYTHENIEINYKGIHYRLPNTWDSLKNEDIFELKVKDFCNKPIKYCEVGVFYGINFILVENTYAKHPDSELVAIDPWLIYDDYPEYKDKDMNNIYETAINNMKLNISNMDKVKIIRDFSHKASSSLQDEYFDIIYIDGNHEMFAVLEDLVLYFRKLKSGGIMIMDDAHDQSIFTAINSFLTCYQQKIDKKPIYYNGQILIMKK